MRIGRNLQHLVPIHGAQFYSRRFTVSQIEQVLFRGAEALTRIKEQVRRSLLRAGAEASKQQDEEESSRESLRMADLSSQGILSSR